MEKGQYSETQLRDFSRGGRCLNSEPQRSRSAYRYEETTRQNNYHREISGMAQRHHHVANQSNMNRQGFEHFNHRTLSDRQFTLV